MAAAPAAAAPKAAAPMAAAPMAAAAGTTQQQKVKTCAASWKAMSASAKAKTTYKAYSSTCLKK